MKAVTGPSPVAVAAHAAQDVNSNDTEDRGRERIGILATAVMLPSLRLVTLSSGPPASSPHRLIISAPEQWMEVVAVVFHLMH